MNNEEMRNKLKDCSQELSKIRDMMNVDEMSLRCDALERLSEANDFWDDTDNASQTLEEINNLKMKIDNYMKLKSSLDDMDVKVQISESNSSSNFENEFNEFLKDFNLKILDLNLKI